MDINVGSSPKGATGKKQVLKEMYLFNAHYIKFKTGKSKQYYLVLPT